MIRLFSIPHFSVLKLNLGAQLTKKGRHQSLEDSPSGMPRSPIVSLKFSASLTFHQKTKQMTNAEKTNSAQEKIVRSTQAQRVTLA